MIAEVAVNLPFFDCLDYKIPDSISINNIIGCRVIIPIRNKPSIGIITSIKETSTFSRLRFISNLVDLEPLFSEKILSLTKWISEYYLCSWGEVLNSSIPSGLNIKIDANILIDKNSTTWSSLAIDEQNKLLEIESLTLNNIKEKNPTIIENTLWKSSILNKLITLDYFSLGKKVKEKEIEWLNLIHLKEEFKFNKGSKTELIINLLQKEKLSKKSVLLEIPGSSSNIKRLLEAKVIEIIKEKYIGQDFFKNEEKIEPFLELNDEQQNAYSIIKKSITNFRFQPYLLHGVTGSGKTEVYMHLTKDVLKAERRTLILLPEISLTPQTVSRFRKRFGNNIAVLHSQISEKERFHQWQLVKKQKVQIVIGTRSAIFSPIENIGLIIIDEEHDSSFKQNESPFYNARDTAVKLAKDNNIPIILGSATPSIESYQNTKNKKYELITLNKRAGNSTLPKVDLIHLGKTSRVKGVFYLSKNLYNSLYQNFHNKKQSLLFLNRRGYSSLISCKDCETPILCKNCSTTMTWHKKKRFLICHYCTYEQNKPSFCNLCGSENLIEEGIGTQRVERDLKILFPKSRLIRMDKDTIKNTEQLEKALSLIKNNEVDFIIGTQLISKGHDFQNIGLVAILLADSSLNIPDFRSSEKTFQLISQVSGRAGRSLDKGLSIIQSFNPDHFVFQNAKNVDFINFFEKELINRNILQNPPFYRLINLKISSENEFHSKKSAENLYNKLNELIKIDGDTFIFGPIEAPVYKINNRFYWTILLKSKKGNLIKSFCKKSIWMNSEWKKGSTRLSVDVDPYFI